MAPMRADIDAGRARCGRRGRWTRRVATSLGSLAAVLVPAAVTAGCSVGADEEAPRPVVAFLGGADPDGRHYEGDAAALRDALAADCEDCEYAALDAGGDADLQAEQMGEVLDGGADVVVLEAVDAERGEELVARAGDVPVVTMDRFVPGATHHVGYDPAVAARVLARATTEQVDDPAADLPAPGVLLLGTSRGDVAGRETTAATREALVEAGAEVLAEETPEVATAETARQWVADQVGQRPLEAVAAVVATGETQAEGVAAAYEEAGVEPADRPAVVGVGTDLDSLRRLITEEQAVALHEPRDALVRRVVATAAELLEGAPVTDTVDVEGVPSFLGRPESVTLRTLTSVMVRGGEVTTAELCEGDTADPCARLGIR